MKQQVVCIGDMTMDIFLHMQQEDLHCHIDEKLCEVCLPLGAKIPLQGCVLALGGIACNVAVGLARLGIQTSLLAEIGDDMFAHNMQAFLKKETVDTSGIIQTKGANSSVGVALHMKKERTMFVHHEKRRHNFLLPTTLPSYVYLAGLGNEWETIYTMVETWSNEQRIPLIFTPGSAQLEEKSLLVSSLIASSAILIVNRQEAAFLADVSEKTSPEDLLHDLQNIGAKIVVITDGIHGSFAIDTKKHIFTQEIIPVSVIEKTGAGDGFASGFLASYLQKERIQDALRLGTKNAASVIGSIGAQKGLLYTTDL